MKTYYTVYKITNNLNGKIYIGAHKTDNLDDEYMGSGKAIRNSINKYGKCSFSKEYIHIGDCEELMYFIESEIVDTKFKNNQLTYNQKEGGNGGFDYINENGLAYKFTDEDIIKAAKANKGRVVVKDNNGNTSKVSINDESYKCGKLKHITTGKVTVRDDNGTRQVTKEEAKANNLSGVCKGTVSVEIIATKERKRIDVAEYHKNKHLYKSSGAHSCDKHGKALKIKVYDNNDVLVFESHGNFEQMCKEYNIENYLIKKSYQTNTKVQSVNARKEENRKLNGWYAIKYKG